MPLHAALRANTGLIVQAVRKVTVIVREVGDNLQQHGDNKHEDKDLDPKGPARRRQSCGDERARRRQR